MIHTIVHHSQSLRLSPHPEPHSILPVLLTTFIGILLPPPKVALIISLTCYFSSIILHLSGVAGCCVTRPCKHREGKRVM